MLQSGQFITERDHVVAQLSRGRVALRLASFVVLVGFAIAVASGFTDNRLG